MVTPESEQEYRDGLRAAPDCACRFVDGVRVVTCGADYIRSLGLPLAPWPLSADEEAMRLKR